ncbi:helix-turn-helix domain-containing protein [Cellvibrio mixtus]|uniref:helix-turn-helix domain-containing protein n=1 Tax=Cellvibrio mixtus TaxID=39650 RepID=UPI0005870103|nr:AraC family transcriptional regulator [Cellvibrio mixtus]
MHEAFKTFVLSTIVINLWTVFLLLQDKRGNKLLNRWFAVFLIALSFPQLDLYANQIIPGGIFQLTVTASTFLWLKGPFIRVFIKVLTREKIGVSTGIHFLPWLCVLITLLNFPQYFMPCMFMGMAHMFGYLLFSLWRLIGARPFLASLWYGFPNSAFYWLLYVIGGVMALVTVDFIVMSLVLSGALNTYNVLDYFAFPFFSVYVLSVGILSVYRPELLFRETPGAIGFKRDAVNGSEMHHEEDKSVETVEIPYTEPVPQKERHLELDASVAQELIHQLTQLMVEQRVYLQNELSLPDLAGHLGISVNQVSELLNVHAGLSFYDYVNDYRLKYACCLLSDPQCHLRILDIAFEAGYNNKNSFYRAFKENLGVTPNQYRAKILAAVQSAGAMET